MDYSIEIIMDGPEVRAIRLLDSSNNIVREESDNSNYVIEPCNPPCEGMTSYCCQLDRCQITGLLAYPAEVLFEALLAGLIAREENWVVD